MSSKTGEPRFPRYVATYLREEVQQEGLTRNLGAFRRFLETASFSQAAPVSTKWISCSMGSAG